MVNREASAMTCPECGAVAWVDMHDRLTCSVASCGWVEPGGRASLVTQDAQAKKPRAKKQVSK